MQFLQINTGQGFFYPIIGVTLLTYIIHLLDILSMSIIPTNYNFEDLLRPDTLKQSITSFHNF